MNERIRVPEVRLVAEDGSQLGVKRTMDALSLAREKGLDLVLIAPNASPPVAKIIDFGKFKYEQSKHDKEVKKSQRSSGLKEIKLTPKIGDHDLNVRITKTREFLTKKQKVKLSLYFRGREMAHKEYGQKVVDRFLAAIADMGVPEKEAKMEGRNLVLIIVPK